MRLCAIGLAFAAAFAAPAWADTLVVCTEAAPATLNPQLSTANTVFDVGSQIYDELVETARGTSDIIPALATSWEIAPNGLSATFHLREGVQFHSSPSFTPTRPMNADDVVWSFDRMRNPANPFNKVSGGTYDEWDALLRDRVSDVVKVDEHTVRFVLKEPVAPLLGILSMPSFAIFSAEYAAKMQAAGTPERLDTAPIGTGPFSFLAYQKDVAVRFRAFPTVWSKAAGVPDRVADVDGLVFSVTPDPAVRLAKLRRNECQIVRYPNPADFDSIRADKSLALDSGPLASMGYIAFRADRPPFDKQPVRAALAEAIDLDSLVAAVFQGTGTPTGAMVSSALWGHDDHVKPRRYDPADAKAKLAAAGYPNGLKTELWAIPVARAYMPNGKQAAEMIQHDWAQIGVEANIVTYDWTEYLHRIRAGDAPVGMLGGTWDYPDPSQLLYGYFACPDGKPRPGNWSHWCNAEYTDLVARANVISDQAERAKLYIQAQDVFAREVPAVLFASTNSYSARRTSVIGYKAHVMGGTPFSGISLKP